MRQGRIILMIMAVLVTVGIVTASGAVAEELPKLRMEASVLTPDQVQMMLVTRDFYDKNRNMVGKGVAHQYEQKVMTGQVVVTDAATGNTWQKGGAPAAMTQEEAADYVKKLNTDKVAGFSDWRVPTLEEAMSLMEPNAREKEQDKWHIHPIFERRQPFIWTSDRTPNGRGWVVYYSDGITTVERPEFNAYVRAVR